EVQHMSAGTGVMHSEFNPSPKEPVHLYQIWIEPNKDNVKPRYSQTRFAPETRTNTLKLVASSDGADGSVPIYSDARLFASTIEPGKSASPPLAKGRHSWVQILRGDASVNGSKLSTGDGAAISDESSVTIKADQEAEILLFDLA